MSEMTVLDHLVELRVRLIKSAVAVLVMTVLSFGWLEPIAFELARRPLGGRPLLYLGITEAFTVHLWFAFYLGLALALPIVAWQAWAFVAPGLHVHERRAVLKLTTASTGLFLAGASFGYTVLLPVVVQFFLSYEADGLAYGGALESYLKLVAGLLLGTGAAFQLPIILFGLMLSGVVTRKTLADQRGYWILAIVTAAAVLTPTSDVITQLLLAVPMWLLFEGALVAAWISGVGRERVLTEEGPGRGSAP